MSVEISIPTALRSYTDGQSIVEVEASTVHEALDTLTNRYAQLARHLRDDNGKLRSFVNVYLGDEDIRFLAQREKTPVQSGDNLIIVPSIAGG